jgi:site-specific DNA-methyltransferase (adenine-specific)
MKTLPDNSVDAIVSDPPYGISFMAKKWDYDVPSVEVWKEAMRVLKPGGHALIACGTRTQHRMVCNIEDAGFEIRDVVSWIYGSGFPKSLNISKAIDKAAGAEREVVGVREDFAKRANTKPSSREKMGKFADDKHVMGEITASATDEAKQWDGWGTALKPACEFFTLCRKPLSEKTIAANVLKWGTGGINIDGCRVGTGDTMKSGRHTTGDQCGDSGYATVNRTEYKQNAQGRFPANLIHSGEQEVLELFPETAGGGKKPRVLKRNKETTGWSGGSQKTDNAGVIVGDNGGSAARFFYCAKASKKDRDEGLEGFEEKKAGAMTGKEYREDRPTNHPMRKNTHPTVKPTALMAYLCRLITPKGGVVLDPYMGSGSTGKAAVREGFSFVGIELDSEYYEIAKARVVS